MKKLWMILLALLLAGCGQQPVMETVADEQVYSVMAFPRSVAVNLPEDAAVPVLESDTQQLYLCDGYEIALEKMESGDLPQTVRHISGYAPEALTLMKTRQGDTERYEFVWASAGEQGDRLGRAVILDDGRYHYCLSVLRDAQVNTQQWESVFSSFRLTEEFIRTD